MGEETRRRALCKALSWRITGTIATVGIVGLATGQWGIAAAVGGAESLIKMVLYFFHERLWNRISFGRRPVNLTGQWEGRTPC